MRLFYKILLSCWFIVAAQAANFFDYSDETALLARFRTFEAKHGIEFAELKRLGFFDQIFSDSSSKVIETAGSLIKSLAFESGRITDSSSEALKALKKSYGDFYAHYYQEYCNARVSDEMLRYLLIFSNINKFARTAK